LEVEADKQQYWRWSKGDFIINIPEKVDKVILDCSTPIENGIIITSGGNQFQETLKVGNNLIVIEPRGELSISGRMLIPFIPSQNSEKNRDNRNLGICLKNIILKLGDTDLTVNVKELSKNLPAAMNFRL
jgi:hypothetical protein